MTVSGSATGDIPFSRLPRYERLRIQGKADEGQVVEDEEDQNDDDENTKQQKRAEKEKKKMRGKNKSLSRYVSTCVFTQARSHLETGIYGSNERTSLIQQL